MVEWKKRFVTGLVITPLIFVIIHYSILISLLCHVATFLAWGEYRKLVQTILKLHSSESEHQYINSLSSSAKAIGLVHLMLLSADMFDSEALVHFILLITMALQCLGRILDFLNFLKIVVKKESLQQDPVLDRKIFVLTFLQMASDTLGLLLFVYPLTFILLMNNSEYIFPMKLTNPNRNRMGYIILWFVAAWQTDNGALFLGALIGKNPFSPQVSPKKTWEGVAGGIFLSVFSAFVLSLFSNEQSIYLPRWPTKHYLIISLIISFVSLLGDYLESFIKRAANTKDSGNLLPGHGGMLDRLDSLALTAPIVYFYAKLMSPVD